MLFIESTELLDAFKNYYDKHSNSVSKSFQNEIGGSLYHLGSLLRYSFPSNYTYFQKQLHELWKSSIHEHYDSEPFSTSGTSSNQPRTYRFGPEASHWVRILWNTMVYPFGWRPMAFLRRRGIDNEFKILPKKEGLYQWEIDVYLNDQHTFKLIEFLHKQINQYGVFSILMVPEALLFLAQTPCFLDFAEKHRDQMNILSWHWEPFFKKQSFRERGIWFGNHMIDWTSGINFYTCKNGHQHVLPIFIDDSINALNLIKQNFMNGGDNMEISSVVHCTCGFVRPIYNHYPHFKNTIRSIDGRIFFDLDLPDHLQSRYKSLQFIQQPNGEEIVVYYDVDGQMNDKPFLESIIQSYGFRASWIPQSYTMGGHKRIPFFSLKECNDS